MIYSEDVQAVVGVVMDSVGLARSRDAGEKTVFVYVRMGATETNSAGRLPDDYVHAMQCPLHRSALP